jgi:hypothetical protein
VTLNSTSPQGHRRAPGLHHDQGRPRRPMRRLLTATLHALLSTTR